MYLMCNCQESEFGAKEGNWTCSEASAPWEGAQGQPHFQEFVSLSSSDPSILQCSSPCGVIWNIISYQHYQILSGIFGIISVLSQRVLWHSIAKGKCGYGKRIPTLCL